MTEDTGVRASVNISQRLDRRRLVARLAAAGFSAPLIASILTSRHEIGALAQDAATPAATPDPLAALVAQYGKDPRLVPYGTTNFGMPLDLVDGLIVPNELFFVRSNGPTPTIDPATWRLRVSGLVNRPQELSLDDLKAMPKRTLTAFLECSGDSRNRFTQEVEGTKWGNDAVGNAEWGGVSLRAVLDAAGVQDGAVDVVCQGGDFPEMQRGLPITLAADPDTMIVWQMNGVDLPVPNGGPVRLFVPGWGGIASTKWLVGLDVIDRQFAGQYNSESYVIIDEAGAIVRPVEEMPVKSVIATPTANTQVAAGAQTVAGYAWSGYGDIARVEVSTDGGATYAEAPIAERAGPRSWVRFEFPWQAAAGEARLRSRAADTSGLTQPEIAPWNAKGYQMNAIFEVPVTVA